MARVLVLGLQPAGDDGALFQTFIHCVSLDATILTLPQPGDRPDRLMALATLAFSRLGAIDAGHVVLPQYGIVARPAGKFTAL